MALATGTSARAHRLIGLTAALLLAATAAIAFGRVFVGGTTTLELLATALAAAGLAVLFERRSLLLATLVSAAGLAIAVGLIVFPQTTWYGLPTAHTLHEALDAAALVGEQARIQVAPAEPIAPLLLAAVVSLWAALFSAHALAFRAGSPLLGLIPPVALVAFADTVLEEFVKPLYGVAFLAAALLVVFADGLARVQGWGPVWSSTHRGVVATAGRGARRLGLAALAAAFLAPVLVPGFGSKAVVDFGTPSEDRVAIDPFVSVTASLTRKDPIEVLRVTAPRPTYIRLVSLPDFDGVQWHPEMTVPATAVAPGAAVPRVDGQFGVTETVGIDVTANLDMPWMPTPYPVKSIEFPGASVRYDPETGTAFLDGHLGEGDSYTVQAGSVRPTADQLRAVPQTAPDPRYVALPEDTPDEIRQLAQTWTAGTSNTFDRAMAIQDHLRDTTQFHYDEHVNARASTRTILEFLTQTKRGFCQQFSTSMAVLLRSIGIPSRVVVGFTSGTQDPVSSQYSITTDRAHSWVEVWFPGWGWLPFEPTPGRTNPVTVGYTEPTGTDCVGSDCPPPGQVPGGPGAQQEDPGATQRDRIETDPRATGPRGAVGGDAPVPAPLPERRITARTTLLLAAILATLVLLLVPPVRGIQRRLRLRRAAAEPRRLILAAYDVFTERARGLGLGRGHGETMEEYRRKVMETGYLSNGHLDRLTQLATAAAYSGRSSDEDDARQALDAADIALREIRRAVGPTRWLVGLYRRS